MAHKNGREKCLHRHEPDIARFCDANFKHSRKKMSRRCPEVATGKCTSPGWSVFDLTDAIANLFDDETRQTADGDNVMRLVRNTATHQSG
jgi:hypothetical protein